MSTITCIRMSMCAAAALAAASASAQPVLTPVPWPFSPTSMRPDGTMLAGSNWDFVTGSQPATWSLAGGVQVYSVPAGTTSGEILGVSDNGSKAAGVSSFQGSWGTSRATIWQAGVPQTLGHLPGGVRSAALGISGDGSTVVGWSDIGNSRSRAFRWTASHCMQDLGTTGEQLNSGATSISHDGTVITGNTYRDGTAGSARPFRWTAAGGMQDLGLVAGGSFAMAQYISGDGSVIIGTAHRYQNEVSEAGLFRWSESLGMEFLGSLGLPFAERTEMRAAGVSASGEAVVGSALDATSGPGGFGRFAAVYWTRATGLVDLNTYLPSLGLDLGGYSLSTADAISSDGSIIVGTGFAPDGSFATWMVSGVPAPGTIVMLGVGALTASRRRRLS